MTALLDLYTDYLISSFGQTSSTRLSDLLDHTISHDKFSRFLSGSDFDSKFLWKSIKPLVREHESHDACLIFDDCIIEKQYTDENDLISWHWDHSKSRNVKGINILSCFYHTQKTIEREVLRIPVLLETIKKDVRFYDEKTQKEKRKSAVTKNQLMQQMIQQSIQNGLLFKHILADSWFSSTDNMRFIQAKKKFFIFDMMTNRLACLTKEDRNKGSWTNINSLKIPNNTPVKVWLKDLDFPVLLTKQVFTNKDSSIGVRFLVSNDFSLTDEQFTTLYKKRWSVEEYHKSIKQNTSAAKSPTRTVKTQTNHLFASILAYVKLERIKLSKKISHFTLKTKIYQKALKAAFQELNIIKQNFA